MADIFISYAREDREWVEKLATAFQEEGYSVWWDWDLLVGKRYRETIENELQTCKATVVIWSEQSVKSDFVRDEAEEGQQRNILVPVLKQAVRPPAGFRQLQTADLSGWNGDAHHAEFRRMLKGISHLIGREPKSGLTGGGAQDTHADAVPAVLGVTSAPVVSAPVTPPPSPRPATGPSLGASSPPPNAPLHTAGFATLVNPSGTPQTASPGAAATSGGPPAVNPKIWRYVGIGAGALVLLIIVLAAIGGSNKPGPKPSTTTAGPASAPATTPPGTNAAPASGSSPGSSTTGEGETTTTPTHSGGGGAAPSTGGADAGGQSTEGRHSGGGSAPPSDGSSMDSRPGQ